MTGANFIHRRTIPISKDGEDEILEIFGSCLCQAFTWTHPSCCCLHGNSSGVAAGPMGALGGEFHPAPRYDAGGRERWLLL